MLKSQGSILGYVPKDKPAPVEWHVAVWIVILSCGAVLALFWHTVGTMVDIWAHSRTFAHGFLVLPACVYLIWCYRGRLSVLVPTPCRWGLLLIMVTASGWFVAYQTHTLLAQQVAVILMLPGLVWATLGTDVLRAILFPLGFLVFALPVGTSVEPWLQDFTTAFIIAGLKLIRIPVISDEYFITIPSGTWEVARDCGGLRYVLPGLALGYLYAAVTYRHSLRRLGFLLLCVSLLILANGFRAYAIVVSDYLGITEGTDHRVFSYAVYGVTMISLFWLGLKWKEPAQNQGWGKKAGESHESAGVEDTALTALAALGLLALAPLSTWLLSAHG